MSNITVIVATSVLPSHPDTRIIDETMATIKHHLPDSEVIMQIDGIRDEQQDRKKDYEDYKTKVLWKCLHEWGNTLPLIFDTLHHQSGMIRATMEYITTPLILYIEGDCPLVTNKSIEWDLITELILSGEANTVRLHHEDVIPEDHNNLMIGEKGKFTKTIQWSQRPHVSSKIYYEDVVIPTLPESNFIEDTFHGVVMNDYYKSGMLGWYKHRLWIYTPKKGIKRSYTTDGREGGLKYTSDDLVWQK